MATKDAASIADQILEEPRKAIERDRNRRLYANRARKLRRATTVVPVITGACGVLVARDYVDSIFLCLAIGALVGALFGWAAKRSYSA
ncbi:MAG: hypothetical protein AAGL69_03530 [Pseudomonadota bacterium]